MEPADTLRNMARSAGAAGFGICDAAPFPEVQRSIESAVAEGRNAGMAFTFGDPERSTDVRRSFPWARRLVVVAWSYLAEAGNPTPSRPGTGRVARFATEDHYRPLRDLLGSLAGVVEGAGGRAEVVCDDNRLVDRAAAVRAGVGWWGKNTLVLVPGAGPWSLLGSVVTDLELEVDEPMRRHCGTCTACLPACPTGALVAPGVLDARRCLAAVLQTPGSIPRDLREAVGGRFYGCDDCLDACPPGHRALGEVATLTAGDVDLAAVLSASDDELLVTYGHFYIPRRRADYLRRNALVALGNVGQAGHVPLLAGYLNHSNPMLRAHAAWALGRIGTEEAKWALEQAIRHEEEPTVRGEIEAALAEP